VERGFRFSVSTKVTTLSLFGGLCSKNDFVARKGDGTRSAEGMRSICIDITLISQPDTESDRQQGYQTVAQLVSHRIVSQVTSNHRVTSHRWHSSADLAWLICCSKIGTTSLEDADTGNKTTRTK